MRRPPRPRRLALGLVVPTAHALALAVLQPSLVAARFARARLLLRALHALAVATLLVVLLRIGQGILVLLERLDGVNALEDADVNVVRILGDGGNVLRGRQRLHQGLGGGGELLEDEEAYLPIKRQSRGNQKAIKR